MTKLMKIIFGVIIAGAVLYGLGSQSIYTLGDNECARIVRNGRTSIVLLGDNQAADVGLNEEDLARLLKVDRVIYGSGLHLTMPFVDTLYITGLPDLSPEG